MLRCFSRSAQLETERRGKAESCIHDDAVRLATMNSGSWRSSPSVRPSCEIARTKCEVNPDGGVEVEVPTGHAIGDALKDPFFG